MKYNPELTCLLVGGKNVVDFGFLDVAGGRNGYSVILDVALLFGDDTYRFPDNLPINGAKGGPGGQPGCGSLPDVAKNFPQRYLVTNTGGAPGRTCGPIRVSDSPATSTTSPSPGHTEAPEHPPSGGAGARSRSGNGWIQQPVALRCARCTRQTGPRCSPGCRRHLHRAGRVNPVRCRRGRNRSCRQCRTARHRPAESSPGNACHRRRRRTPQHPDRRRTRQL